MLLFSLLYTRFDPYCNLGCSVLEEANDVLEASVEVWVVPLDEVRYKHQLVFVRTAINPQTVDGSLFRFEQHLHINGNSYILIMPILFSNEVFESDREPDYDSALIQSQAGVRSYNC